MNTLAANRRLAELLGWTNIIESGGALVGTPPPGTPQCRGQAQIPDWAGDWREAGPLGALHEIDIFHSWTKVHGQWSKSEYSRVQVTERSDGSDDRNAANRLAIVQAVIAKMEAGQ